MRILGGSSLVLLTWVLLVVGIAAIGTPFAISLHRKSVSVQDLRRGLWWGLALFAVISMLIGNYLPLGSLGSALIVGGLAVLGAGLTVRFLTLRGWQRTLRVDRSIMPVFFLALASVGYFAVAALGPVTNFDSGLYHLNAITHSFEYSIIPGLANLDPPLGYSNASFPMSALLGSGPWRLEGYRLLNGFIIVLVLTDLLVRWASRKRGPGAYGLLVGSVALLIPMLALSDYWVTSPSQDSAVFAVTIAVSAMLMEAAGREEGAVSELSTALAASLLLVLLRPTMVAFLIGVILVAVALSLRHGLGVAQWKRPLPLVAFTAVLASVVQILRDFGLSGWLLYPLSIYPFDVAWLAPDPVNLRTATLGFHRDPINLWESAHGWAWIGPWVSKLPQQWETWALALLTVAIIFLVVTVRRLGINLRPRAMYLAMIPSAGMVLFWWLVTPPSFRFGWGPVFTFLTIPLAWLLWRLATFWKKNGRNRWAEAIPVVAMLPVIAVVAFSGATRLDLASITSDREWRLGIKVPYAVAPVQQPDLLEVPVRDGLVVQVPRDKQLCWETFPLCTTSPNVEVGLLRPEVGLPGGLSLP